MSSATMLLLLMHDRRRLCGVKQLHEQSREFIVAKRERREEMPSQWQLISVLQHVDPHNDHSVRGSDVSKAAHAGRCV